MAKLVFQGYIIKKLRCPRIFMRQANKRPREKKKKRGGKNGFHDVLL